MTQLELPGLEQSRPDGMPEGALRGAVKATLVALQEQGLLKAEHAGVAQLALVMADAVEAGTNSKRASAAAMAAGQLLAALEALPKPEVQAPGKTFADLVEEWKNA